MGQKLNNPHDKFFNEKILISKFIEIFTYLENSENYDGTLSEIFLFILMN